MCIFKYIYICKIIPNRLNNPKITDIHAHACSVLPSFGFKQGYSGSLSLNQPAMCFLNIGVYSSQQKLNK